MRIRRTILSICLNIQDTNFKHNSCYVGLLSNSNVLVSTTDETHFSLFQVLDESVEFTKAAELPATMKFVAEFLYDKGILGEGAPSPEFVGVAFADGSIYGDANNVKLRFDPSFMQMAVDGAL